MICVGDLTPGRNHALISTPGSINTDCPVLSLAQQQQPQQEEYYKNLPKISGIYDIF